MIPSVALPINQGDTSFENTAYTCNWLKFSNFSNSLVTPSKHSTLPLATIAYCTEIRQTNNNNIPSNDPSI